MEKEVKRKKSPAKTLKVMIKNKAVEGNKATDVFVNAIKMIGPAKITELNKYTVDGLPLIVPKRDNRKQMNSLGKQGYVCTHLSTIGKRSLLERIGQDLNIKIKVEIEEPSEQNDI
jgi:hypothetical protein